MYHYVKTTSGITSNGSIKKARGQVVRRGHKERQAHWQDIRYKSRSYDMGGTGR